MQPPVDPAAEKEEEVDAGNEAQENLEECVSAKEKKKRNRKHNRAKKKETESAPLRDGDSPVLKVLQQETSSAKPETGKSKKKQKVKKAKNVPQVQTSQLVLVTKSTPTSVPKSKNVKSCHVNGLPRDLYAKTPEELIKYSFGRFCIQKTAKVVAIVEKNHTRVSGGKLSLMPGNDFWVKFSPQDSSRTPRILLPITQIDSSVINNLEHHQQSLFLATITDWPCDSQLPTGELTQFLGESGDIEAESFFCCSWKTK